MEPKQPLPRNGGEFLPQNNGNYYPMPPSEVVGPNTETHLERSVEQPVMSQERESMVAGTVALPTLPAPLPQVQQQSAINTPQSDDTPSVAGDDDLIEKEWVDKAKKIITETRDDPYRREQEIAKLQIEYIRKRYNREIGETHDQ